MSYYIVWWYVISYILYVIQKIEYKITQVTLYSVSGGLSPRRIWQNSHHKASCSFSRERDRSPRHAQQGVSNYEVKSASGLSSRRIHQKAKSRRSKIKAVAASDFSVSTDTFSVAAENLRLILLSANRVRAPPAEAVLDPRPVLLFANHSQFSIWLIYLFWTLPVIINNRIRPALKNTIRGFDRKEKKWSSHVCRPHCCTLIAIRWI